MAVEAKNFLNLCFIFKFIEFVLLLIIVSIAGSSVDGLDMHWALEWPGDDRDLVEAAGKLGVFASIGYFFFTIIMMIGMALGDKPKFQLVLFNLFGIFFFLACGSVACSDYNNYDKNSRYDSVKKYRQLGLALGSMSIILGITYIVDLLFSLLNLRKKD